MFIPIPMRYSSKVEAATSPFQMKEFTIFQQTAVEPVDVSEFAYMDF